MRHSYQALVLRYTHDLVTGESLNVGLLVYSPSAGYLRFTFESKLGRVSESFGRNFKLSPLRARLHRMEIAVAAVANESMKALVSKVPKQESIAGWAATVLPVDDSSLQFEGSARVGMSTDLEKTQLELMDRLVHRYSKGPVRASRTDAEVLSDFRPYLRKEDVLHRFQEKTIASADFQYKFDWAFKNGVWNAIEPLSLDLLEKEAILDKGARWLGRAEALQNGANEAFKLIFLLGLPRDPALQEAASRAVRIIQSGNAATRFVYQSEAHEYAKEVKLQMEHH